MAKPFIFGYHDVSLDSSEPVSRALSRLRAARGIFVGSRRSEGSDLLIVTERQRRAGEKTRAVPVVVRVYEVKG